LVEGAFDVGSGKFDTPCERMHTANFSAAARALELPVVVDLLDEPQATIDSTEQTTASATTRAWRTRCRVSLAVARMSYSGGLARDPSLPDDGLHGRNVASSQERGQLGRGDFGPL
jgi:hypothetical protein